MTSADVHISQAFRCLRHAISAVSSDDLLQASDAIQVELRRRKLTARPGKKRDRTVLLSLLELRGISGYWWMAFEDRLLYAIPERCRYTGLERKTILEFARSGNLTRVYH